MKKPAISFLAFFKRSSPAGRQSVAASPIVEITSFTARADSRRNWLGPDPQSMIIPVRGFPKRAAERSDWQTASQKPVQFIMAFTLAVEDRSMWESIRSIPDRK